MKRTRNRSILVLLVALAFVAGMCLFCVRLFMGCSEWVQKPFNGHITGSNGLVQAGKITDKDGVILAQSIDGERVYHSDYDTRCSLLHLVGDDSLNISTSVQSLYRSDLMRYSFVWGLGVPASLRTSYDIQLTVDSSACRTAYQQLGDKTGCCIVYNYKTGEILCDVSTKTYDPQNAPEITEENEEQYEGVYLDHTVSSAFTPGSTFKIVTAAAALENITDIQDLTINCEGSRQIGDNEITCTHEHGEVNLESAFVNSCNVYFATVATMVGNDKMQQTADDMGFNKNYKINAVTTEQSSYDVKQADDNQLAWSGVGQYTNLANPMQMAIMCSGIANDGVAKIPHFIKSKGILDFNLNSTEDTLMSKETAQSLKDLMRSAVTDKYGEDMFCGLTAYAKTGTAEVGEGEPTSWIVGFTSDEEYPLAFAVVVEHGGYGIDSAGSVISAVLADIIEDLV